MTDAHKPQVKPSARAGAAVDEGRPVHPEPAAAPLHRRIATQTVFEIKAIVRNGEQLLLSVLLPLGLLAALSTTEVLDVISQAPQRGSHVDTATSGVLALAISASAFAGQAIATGFDRRYGVLRQLATTPLGASGLVLSKIVAVYAVVALQFALIFTLAGILGFSAHVSVLGVVLAALLGTAALVSLALLMAGTLRAEATLAFANILWVVMASVGGVLFTHPGLWGWITSVLPFGALGDAMRAAILDAAIDWPALGVLAIWTVFGILACRAWFSFDSK